METSACFFRSTFKSDFFFYLSVCSPHDLSTLLFHHCKWMWREQATFKLKFITNCRWDTVSGPWRTTWLSRIYWDRACSSECHWVAKYCAALYTPGKVPGLQFLAKSTRNFPVETGSLSFSSVPRGWHFCFLKIVQTFLFLMMLFKQI